MRLASLFFAVLLLGGCIGNIVPQTAARYSHKAACAQALKQGWCYEGCRKRPDYCCEPRDVKCNAAGMCSWRGCDGSLVFGIVR